MKTLTVIDAFGFFFRSYYALPPLKSESGFPTGLLTGFLRFVNKLHQNHDTDYILFCVDSKGKSFRNDIYKEYKANRPSPPDDLKAQLPVAIDWIKKMGFNLLEQKGMEADDLIASITKRANEHGIFVKIVSHDKDMYQLIDNNKAVILDAVRNRIIDENGCFEKFEVYPKDFIQFQSILGDSSDNVPGVKGIGVKGASKLINQYNTLEKIYEDIESIKPPGVQKKLIESKESAFISRELVSLKQDIFDDYDFKKAVMPEDPIANIADELEKYSMKVFGSKKPANSNGKPSKTEFMQKVEESKNSTFEAVTIDDKEELFKLIDTIPNASIVAFDTETDDLDTKKAKLVGFSFATDCKKGYYIPVGHFYLGVGKQVALEDAKTAIEKLFTKKVVGHNLKFDLKVLQSALGLTPGFYSDTMILGWLKDPSSQVGLDKLAKRYFGHEMISFKDTVKKGENFSSVAIEDATNYAAEDAVMTLRLYELFDKTLSDEIREELESVEIPFVKTLITLENSGLLIDKKFLKGLEREMGEKIARLQEEIYTLAGNSFNINSPKQLGAILFETLGLKTGKKTKTGYSTDEQTLKGLMGEHEIIGKILEYREVHKLKSTYATPILERAKKEGRIHTNFLHTGTATGRLSSKDPNLQNIPVRTAMGREIRRAFIPERGNVFIGFDYSQIELRLLAHFSKDPVLLMAFGEDKDIHLETARKIFGEEEAPEKRSLAKSINFGLIYGMGSKKLSESVGITTKEAKAYIEGYFASFPTVKSFLEDKKVEAKEKGFVSTLLNRQRFFDFVGAAPRNLAAFEREAVNTIFQGSAADLIKLSMNKIQNEIENKEDIKPVLQIHDELVYEVQEEKQDLYVELIKNIMEGIVKLEVPLKVSVNRGKNWSELK